jgi:hypothetical protein
MAVIWTQARRVCCRTSRYQSLPTRLTHPRPARPSTTAPCRFAAARRGVNVWNGWIAARPHRVRGLRSMPSGTTPWPRLPEDAGAFADFADDERQLGTKIGHERWPSDRCATGSRVSPEFIRVEKPGMPSGPMLARSHGNGIPSGSSGFCKPSGLSNRERASRRKARSGGTSNTSPCVSGRCHRRDQIKVLAPTPLGV